MELLEDHSVVPVPLAPETLGSEHNQLAARRSLRSQIVKLERELAQAFVTAAAMGGLEPVAATGATAPRLLELGELEIVRDRLAERLRSARAFIHERASEQEAARVRLERMLLEPGRYRFHRVTLQELGESGCGAWQVRPRLGLIGMLMGWWQVKLSSGCPLPGGLGAGAAAHTARSGTRHGDRSGAGRPCVGH